MRAEQDRIEVRPSQARHAALLWYLRNRLKDIEISENETRVQLIDRIKRLGQGALPSKIQVPRALTEDSKEVSKYKQASANPKDWPGDPHLFNDGFDQNGNEYWCAVHYSGQNPQAAGFKTGQKKDDTNTFMVNNVEIRLAPGKQYCLRGRYVRHVKDLQDCQLPDMNAMQDDYGRPVQAKGDWVKPIYETPERFLINVIAILGPTGSHASAQGKEQYLPNQQLVENANIEFDRPTILNGMSKARAKYESTMRQKRKLAAARAREVLEQEIIMNQVTKGAMELPVNQQGGQSDDQS